GALPRERPPAGLDGEIVGSLPNDEDLLVARERKDIPVVLEQDGGALHRLPGELSTHERVRVSGESAPRGTARPEETRAHLHAQDAGHGIIDARHGDRTARDELDGVL